MKYAKLGRGCLKSRLALTPNNMLERATIYSFAHGLPKEMSLLDIMLHMCRCGQFYPAGLWLGGQGSGYNLKRAMASWKMHKSWESTNMDDIHAVFFPKTFSGALRTYDPDCTVDTSPDAVGGAMENLEQDCVADSEQQADNSEPHI